MTEQTALDLFRQAISAGIEAQIVGNPPVASGPAEPPGEVEYQVRITSRSGPLGPDVLGVIAAAGVSLGSSDALLI